MSALPYWVILPQQASVMAPAFEPSEALIIRYPLPLRSAGIRTSLSSSIFTQVHSLSPKYSSMFPTAAVNDGAAAAENVVGSGNKRKTTVTQPGDLDHIFKLGCDLIHSAANGNGIVNAFAIYLYISAKSGWEFYFRLCSGRNYCGHAKPSASLFPFI